MYEKKTTLYVFNVWKNKKKKYKYLVRQCVQLIIDIYTLDYFDNVHHV